MNNELIGFFSGRLLLLAVVLARKPFFIGAVATGTAELFNCNKLNYLL